MKSIALIIIALSLTACASTAVVNTPENEAWHKREEQRIAVEQDKRALTVPQGSW